jgi:hypothetical protein
LRGNNTSSERGTATRRATAPRKAGKDEAWGRLVLANMHNTPAIFTDPVAHVGSDRSLKGFIRSRSHSGVMPASLANEAFATTSRAPRLNAL